MSKATDKLAKLLKNLKKLPAKRQAYYLQQLRDLETLIKNIEKLKDPTSTELGSDDWVLGLANWLDKAYSGTTGTISNVTKTVQRKYDDMVLQSVNQLDKIYTGIADEVKKLPGIAGKGLTDFTGSSYWPYAIVFGIVLYVSLPTLVSSVDKNDL